MANSCFAYTFKKEYTATRCQDGILLFWPIEGYALSTIYERKDTLR